MLGRYFLALLYCFYIYGVKVITCGLEFGQNEGRKSPRTSQGRKAPGGASQTVLNFKDKRACCLSNSRLRAERERQEKPDVGFMRSKYRHLQQSGFFGEQF